MELLELELELVVSCSWDRWIVLLRRPSWRVPLEESPKRIWVCICSLKHLASDLGSYLQHVPRRKLWRKYSSAWLYRQSQLKLMRQKKWMNMNRTNWTDAVGMKSFAFIWFGFDGAHISPNIYFIVIACFSQCFATKQTILN